MKNKWILLLLVLFLSGCSLTKPSTSKTEALSTPGAAVALDEPCPANPDQVQTLDEKLPRMYANGFCSIHFQPGSMVGVQMIYPEAWILSLVNPDDTGLLFEQAGKQIFFSAYPQALSLEESDKVAFSFEGSPSEPVVRAEEVEKDRMVQTVGDKEALVLTTGLNDQTIRRYFLVRENTVYVFQLNVLANNMDNTDVIPTIEEMIGWLQFDK
jgi:hypothetical protein